MFWVNQKDRYLRQLLIQDIEEITERELIVYFTNSEFPGSINPDDTNYFADLIAGCAGKKIDLMIETPGGFTWAAQSIISLLTNFTNDLRVIVTNNAKSNGTLIALAAHEIIMGVTSELGPFDPSIPINNQPVPAHYILNAPNVFDAITYQAADSTVKQTVMIAKQLLATHLPNPNQTKIDEIVEALSSKNKYPDHASVINFQEAHTLGLQVTYLQPDDELWQRLWLLHCMMSYDAKLHKYSKIFEGRKVSSAIAASN